MKLFYYLIASIAFVLPLSISSAQEAISASGGNAEGTGGSVSFSAGQLFYMTHTGTNGSVSEGVQQPWEISVVTSVREAEGIILAVSAFPNPVTEQLTLRVDRYNPENLHFQLFDVNGRMVKAGIITGQETIIDMAGFTHATYLLRVMDKNKVIKTFRLIKL